ncbi:MAG: glycosyl hydrolase 2 galactose-binding domain-containing protein, partial [Limisphaerales bacterium]
MPSDIPGEWSLVGRTTVWTNSASVIIQGGFAVEKHEWQDAEITFRARAPLNAGQVQLWAGFHYRDRDSRYVFALRGGNDNDLYLARYAPDGGIKFLGFAPLDFKPKPGIWYRLRVMIFGNRFQIYLNDEKLPRINVVDKDALWDKGSVLLGGGWLPAEYADLEVKPLDDKEKNAFLAIGNQCWAAPEPNKQLLRQTERAQYKPAEATSLNSRRTEISLDGNWLFMPDYQLADPKQPISLNYDDQSWHVMKVPEFWTPGLSWLHGETSFSDLQGVSITKGVADSLYVDENKRVNSYTFDWRKIKSAWYRHYLDLPPNLQGRRFELTFDAIAKISEIWVNGIEVGSHTGMFGQINCDITKAIKPGRNVIAVHVVSETSKEIADKVEGIAVTVAVTSRMLHSLPHGMFQDDVGGIWQPVRLTVTAPVFVKDVFVEPQLNGATINLAIQNSGAQTAETAIAYKIVSAQDGTILYTNPPTQPFAIGAGETNLQTLVTPHLSPKLWSPQDPNLYYLEVQLNSGNKVLDNYAVRFGFRTFAVKGSELLLNGHPYWLRGADPFPNTLRPNDATLAHHFMKLAKAGNVCVTRSHIVPFT